MRGYVPSYELTTPASLAEALAMLANEPGSLETVCRRH